jgi:hypothetical protein
MTMQEAHIAELEDELFKLQRRAEALQDRPAYTVFDKEGKLALLRREYRRLHGKLIEAKGQMAFDV